MTELSPTSLLAHLRQHDIELRAEGDRLHIRAPKGALTAELRVLITTHKPALLTLLTTGEATADLPLSEGQRALWFLSQLIPESSAYNVSLALLLRGPLSIVALQRAIFRLGELHPLLRARFENREGVPVMSIDRRSQLAAEVIDRELLTLAEVQGQAQALSERPFQLSTEGASRLVILRRSSSEAVLLLSVHHIVIDFWSLSTLVNDLFALYRSERSGVAAQESEPRLTYADFVAWQRRFLQSPEGIRQRDYWHARLAGVPPVLDLAGDYPRPALRSEHGDAVRALLNQDLTAQLRRLALAEKTTPFAIVASALTALFYHYTGQDDILLGTPYHGRVKKGFERVVGFFVNFLVLRTQLSFGMSFHELVRQVHLRNLEALRSPDYPFSLLVETLCPQRDASRNPLYQITIDWMTSSEPLLAMAEEPGAQKASLLADLQATPLELRQLDGVSDQIWMIVDLGDRLIIKLGYNTDLFTSEMAGSMLRHFLHLLAQGLAAPEKSIAALELMDEAERDQVLAGAGPTAGEDGPPLLVGTLFAAQVDRNPAAIALYDQHASLTYAALDEQANQLAHVLRTHGCAPEGLVGLYVEQARDLVVGVIAILKAGGACVVIDSLASPSLAGSILADLGTALLVTTISLSERLAAGAYRALDLDTLGAELQQAPRTRPPDEARAEGLAYVIYSPEGETPPSGAMWRHRAIAEAVHGARTAWRVQENCRVLLQRGHHLGPVLLAILVSLCSGGTLVSGPPLPVVGVALQRLLLEESINTLIATPAVVASLPSGDVPSLHTIITHGAPSWSARFKRLRDDIRVIVSYGALAEAPYAAMAELSRSEPRLLVGRPLGHMKLVILDEQNRLVPVGVIGELYLGGPGLAHGYLRREELTAQRFIPDTFSLLPGQLLFRTGVLGRYDRDGTVEFRGLVEEQSGAAGLRVGCRRSEAILLSHPFVIDCLIMQQPSQSAAAQLVAYVSTSKKELSAADLLYFVRSRVPVSDVPAAIVVLDTLPLDPTGSIVRQRLPTPSQHSISTSAEGYVAPMDALEEKLIQIWESTLKTQPIGIHDDFFALGGHSLLAAQVRTQVQTHLQMDFPLSTLLQAGTVARLADFLRQRSRSDAQSSLVLLRQGERRPLFLIHPVGGNVLCYVELARRLRLGETVYGLQSPALEESGNYHATMEELAAHYVTAIRACQPDGPYRLAGWSFGGIAAFEVAQQLAQHGSRVDLLAIIDSVPPALLGAFNAMDDVEVVSWLHGRSRNRREVAAEPSPRHASHAILLDMEERGLLPDPSDRRQIDQMMRVYRHHGQLLRSYSPKPFPGRLMLLLASGRWHMPPIDASASAWQALCTDLVETYTVPGDHFSLLLADQSLELIARTIQASLDMGANAHEGLGQLRRSNS